MRLMTRSYADPPELKRVGSLGPLRTRVNDGHAVRPVCDRDSFVGGGDCVITRAPCGSRVPRRRKPDKPLESGTYRASTTCPMLWAPALPPALCTVCR